MDNRQIDIKSEGRKAFEYAMLLHFDNAPGGKASHYIEDDGDLVLLWSEEKSANKIPFKPMNVKEATDFAWRWLETVEDRKEKYESDYVYSIPAFRTFCGPWGKDEKFEYGFVRIQAIYAWIGK